MYRRMLAAWRLEILVRSQYERMDRQSPSYLMYRHLQPQLSAEQIYRQLAPSFAAHISRDAAQRITAYYESDAGRKALSRSWSVQGVIKDEQQADLTPAELGQVQAFAASPASKELTAMRQQHLETALAAWMDGNVQQIRQVTLRELQDYALRLGTLSADAPVPPFEPTRTGVASFDDGTTLFGDILSGLLIPAREQRFAIQSHDLAHLVAPEKLLALQSVRASQEAVAQVEVLLQRQQLRVEQWQQEASQRLRRYLEQYGGDADIAQRFKPMLLETGARIVRHLQNQRRWMAVDRRILALAEAHVGETSLYKGKLVFRQWDEQLLYSGLQAELASAWAAVQAERTSS